MNGMFRNVPCSWFYPRPNRNVLFQRPNHIPLLQNSCDLHPRLYLFVCLFVCLFICRKCTLIEVGFTSAYCVFWTCFISFVTAGFMKLNDNSKDNFGTVRNRHFTLFWKRNETTETDEFCSQTAAVFWTLSWCMVKLYTKYYLNSTFQIFHHSRQTGLFSKNKNLLSETLLKFRYSE